MSSIGYWVIDLEHKRYFVHRLIYEMSYGEIPEDKEIDHIDGNRANNHIDNLRLVTRSQNQQNRKANKKTKGSYLKGVSAIGRKWRARITVNKKSYALGTFPTEEEAHDAYCVAGKRLHAEYFRKA